MTSWPMFTTASDPGHVHFSAIGISNALFPRRLLRQFVARIGVTHHADAGIVIQHARNLARAISVPSATVTCPACSE